MKKKLYSFSILFLLSIFTFAQAPNWDWAASTGGYYNEYGFGTVTDAAGSVYVTGSFASASISIGGITLTNGGAANTLDFFIAKYDSVGKVRWAKRAGGSGNEEGKGIAIDKSGNVYVVGYYTSPTITFGTTPFLTNAGSANGDIFVAKYDSTGKALWSRTAGGIGDDKGKAITTDASNNVFIIGDFGNSFVLGATTLSNVGGSDVLLAKYDSLGASIWAVSAGGSAADLSSGVATDNAGNIYVLGDYTSSPMTLGSLTLNKTSNRDLFIAMYNPSGTEVWAKRASGGTSDYTYSTGIANDHLGNVIITGYYTSATITFGGTILTNAGAVGTYDIFVVKYNSSGAVTWAKSAGGTSSEESYAVTCDILGDVYITGSFASSPINFGASSLTVIPGGADIFVASYFASGAVQWVRSAGGPVNEKGLGIATAQNNIYVTGNFSSLTCVFDTTNLSNLSVNTGYYDMFVARLDPAIISGVQENSPEEGIQVYPNPSNNNFTVRLPSGLQNCNAEIFNAVGVKVFSKQFNSESVNIKFDGEAGMYFLKITDGQRQYVKKLIFE